MGEENNIFGECKIGFMSEGKFCELGEVVEDSTEWQAEEDDIKSISTSKSYSFQCEIPQTEDMKALFKKPKYFEVAEGLLEDLQKLIKAFRNPEIAMNRRERRAKEREIARKHKRFVAYCKAHNITISQSNE